MTDMKKYIVAESFRVVGAAAIIVGISISIGTVVFIIMNLAYRALVSLSGVIDTKIGVVILFGVIALLGWCLFAIGQCIYPYQRGKPS